MIGPPSGPRKLAGRAALDKAVATNVWGRGNLRLYGVLVGMVVGYVLSAATGMFGAEQLARFSRSSWIAVPWIDGMTDFAFRWSLLPVFAIVSITGALKSPAE